MMRKHIFLLLALCLHIAARGQTIPNDLDLSWLPQPTQAKALRYWIDDDMGSMQTTNILNGQHLVDVSSLLDGLHTIHFQIIDSEDKVATPYSSIFLKIGTMAEAEEVTVNKLVYWFDDEETTTTTDMLSGIMTLDASGLLDGLHTIHYMLVCSDGSITSAYSSIFLKMNIEIQSTTAQSLRYWFDDESDVKTASVSGGTQSIDVSNLLSGLHTLHYQLVDNSGQVTSPVSCVFIKNFDKVLADGGNRVTKYQYWLNTNSQTMQTVELASADNPYTLIALLPMPKEPIHSDYFHFELTDGVPMVYAKNVFHIRFYDAASYFSDGDRTFVDYDVKQEVTDITLLQSGVRETIERPAENTIKWYKVEAELGDSLQFKLNRAATIQLFAPSGELLFSASGAESTQWGGCHAKEVGTFYLALHDVIAQQSNTVSIDYNHIDKYAVLRQNVMFVGNGGCSTITFEGNGFRDLYAVDLYNAQGDTIKHVYIGHESDATTSVAFDFTDAVLGQYDVLFRFATEDKRFPVHVTVEEPKDIELATTVTFPSGFPHGLSTTYTVKITNKGNMTAYSVPVYTWIKSSNERGIYHIDYDGMNLPSLYDLLNKDSLSAEDHVALREFSDEIGDEHYFMCFKVPDENRPGDSVYVRSNYFFADVAPNSTKTLTLTLYANEPVWAYFTVPEDWPVYSSVTDTLNYTKVRKAVSLRDKYCCVKDKIECVITLANDATSLLSVITSVIDLCIPPTALQAKGYSKSADVAMGIIDCGVSSINTIVKSIDEIACGGKYKGIANLIGRIGQNAGGSIISTLWSCFSAKFPMVSDKKYLKEEYRTAYKQLYYGIKAGMTGISARMLDPNLKCLSSFKEPTPGCPPTSSSGGNSNGGMSFDPNDIHGYLSESGSKFMTDSVTMMNYTIEFENDTAFATAAAYKVVVCDTLDGRYFDLASYAPMSVRIGSKQANLDGSQNFVTTVDMRPEINAIAQVEGIYDVQKGIMMWTFTSIDPMTMEPATDIMQGFLPVNYNGNGIGDVSYVVSKKTGLAHRTEISNRASITFDVNEPILTPTWTNIIDRIAPESCVADVQLLNDSTATVSIEATDELSGPWRYDVYVQYGSGAWFKAAENVPADTTANVKVYEGIDHGFYVVVTDSAGNVEQKEVAREFSLNYNAATTVTGDVNGDEAVNGGDVMAVYNSMAGGATGSRSDVNGDGAVNGGDVMAVYDIMAGGRGSVRAFYRKQKKANNIRQRNINVKQ